MRQRTIEPEDMFRLQLLLQAQLSPDGKMVANVVTRVDTKTDKDQFAIWLLSLQSGEARQLTTGTASEGSRRRTALVTGWQSDRLHSICKGRGSGSEKALPHNQVHSSG
jgi:tricorn protease-like protein